MSGKFIVFEGVDRSGKSTQMKIAKDWLEHLNYNVTCVQEPGGTDLGKQLRTILKNKDIKCCPYAQKALFMAARVQLITEIVNPALKRGDIVLCDRYALSTICYQILPNRKDTDAILTPETFDLLRDYSRELSFALDYTGVPNLNLIFDIDFPTWKERGRARNTGDRFEDNTNLIEDVIRNYKVMGSLSKLSELDTGHSKSAVYGISFGNCAIIDGAKSQEAVAGQVRGVISKLLGR